MALWNNRSCLTLTLVVCLATPLFASPLFFNIFRKNNPTTTTTTTASPPDFSIDFSLATNEETEEPSFIERIVSTARLVSAFAKSFISVLTNQHNPDGSRSLEELATEDTLSDFDPFGVEPSEADFDFFSTLEDSNAVGGASRGRSLASTGDDSDIPKSDQVVDAMIDPEAASIDQNVDAKMNGDEATSSGQNMDAKMNGDDAASSGQNMDAKMNGDDAASSGQNMDAKMNGDDAASSGQNVDAEVNSMDLGSRGRSGNSEFSSPDVTKAVLLASTRLE